MTLAKTSVILSLFIAARPAYATDSVSINQIAITGMPLYEKLILSRRVRREKPSSHPSHPSHLFTLNKNAGDWI